MHAESPVLERFLTALAPMPRGYVDLLQAVVDLLSAGQVIVSPPSTAMVWPVR